MIHRAFSLPLSDYNLESEIKTILTIGQNNGFPTEVIRNLIEKKQKMTTLHLIYPKVKYEESKQFISLTYQGTGTERIAKILQSPTTNIAFKPVSKFSNIIFNAKDRTDKYRKSGVYKLKCPECESVYGGQCGRNFSKRYDEHERSFRLNRSDSTFANHLLEQNHSFPPIQDIKILDQCDKGLKLNYFESIEIFKHNNCNCNLLNDQTDLIHSPLFGLIAPYCST